MTIPEELSLGAFSVFDIDSGEVLAAKDPYGLYRPTSIIKALLLLTAIDELDLQQNIPVSDEAANVDGSRVGHRHRRPVTAKQLLLGLVMRSGNDAAIALAEAMGGQDETVVKMQDLADSLGATSTRVMTVHGLDSPGVQTTAYDMSLIYQAVFQNETALDLLGTESMDFPGSTTSRVSSFPATIRCCSPTRARSAARPGSPTMPGTPSRWARSGTVDVSAWCC